MSSVLSQRQGGKLEIRAEILAKLLGLFEKDNKQTQALVVIVATALDEKL